MNRCSTITMISSTSRDFRNMWGAVQVTIFGIMFLVFCAIMVIAEITYQCLSGSYFKAYHDDGEGDDSER